MAVATFEPRLQKFGISANGSVTQVTLVGPVIIAATANGFNNPNIPYLRDWGATCALGGTSTYMQLQISADGVTWTTIDHLELPDSGIVKNTYGKGIPICAAGQQFRVIAIQATAARMTTSLFGYCASADIVDL